jgi:hypothetical protein
MSSAIRFSASGSGASNQASRSASSRGLVGQPDQALAPWPRIGWWLPGTETSSPSQVVQKTLQCTQPCPVGRQLPRQVA